MAEYFKDIIITSPSGIWVDNRAYDTLEDAISAIGSSDQTILISKDAIIESDLTIGQNISLEFRNGATLFPSSGVTVTIEGSIRAGRYRIFNGQGDINITSQLVHEIFPEWWKDNLVPGTTDMTDALNAACGQTVGKVLLSNIYKITNVINTNIPIEGISNSQSIIDASGADALSWSTDPDGHNKIIKAAGAITQIQDLSSDVSKGDTTLTLTSPPTLSEGDILIIYNPTNNSYSGWQSHYRAGEFLKVKSVSGNNVELCSPILSDDGYAAAEVDLYKLTTPNLYFKNFKIIGIGDNSVNEDAIDITYGSDVVLSNLIIEGFSYSGIYLRQCYNLQIDGCICFTDLSAPSSDGNAILISNSQKISVNGGEYSSPNNALTVKGGDYLGCVPNREITIHGGNFSNSEGSAPAINIHGNTELSIIHSCQIKGGLILSGNHNKVSHNNILPPIAFGAAIKFSELSGLDHLVSDNFVESDYFDSNWSIFLDIGGDTGALNTNTPHGGTLVIKNNNVVIDCDGISSGYYIMRIQNRGYSGAESVNLRILNNIIKKKNDSGILLGGIFCRLISGDFWGDVLIRGNIVPGSIEVRYAKNAIIDGNYVHDTYTGPGIVLRYIYNTSKIINNQVHNCRFVPLYAHAYEDLNSIVHICNNYVENFCISNTSNLSYRSAIFVDEFGEAHIHNNVFKSFGEYADYKLNITESVIQTFISNNRFDVRDGAAAHQILTNGSNFNSTQPPEAGVWESGDIAWAYDVPAGGIPGYMCISSGGSYSSTRANNTSYSVGDWVLWDSGTTVWMCTTAGTTDSSPPDISGKVPGDTVTDGTVVWTMMATTYAEWKALANIAS